MTGWDSALNNSLNAIRVFPNYVSYLRGCFSDDHDNICRIKFPSPIHRQRATFAGSTFTVSISAFFCKVPLQNNNGITERSSSPLPFNLIKNLSRNLFEPGTLCALSIPSALVILADEQVSRENIFYHINICLFRRIKQTRGKAGLKVTGTCFTDRSFSLPCVNVVCCFVPENYFVF